MVPRHHLPDEILMAYASGVATPAVSLLVASHLVLCPACRKRHLRLEALGGALLESMPTAAVDDSVLEGVLSRLDEGAPPLAHPPPQDDGHPDEVLPGGLALPRPLRVLVQESGCQWKTIIPGLVREMELPLRIENTPVRLIRARGGFEVPRHTHHGTELNMVLSGGYHDGDEGYERGDVQVADDDLTHGLQIDRGEDCVLLAVNEAPLVPVGLKSKLASWILGPI